MTHSPKATRKAASAPTTVCAAGGTERVGVAMKDILYEFQAQRSQQPSRWDVIDAFTDKASADKAMEEYRDWKSSGNCPGWSGFRIVVVTTVREVLP